MGPWAAGCSVVNILWLPPWLPLPPWQHLIRSLGSYLGAPPILSRSVDWRDNAPDQPVRSTVQRTDPGPASSPSADVLAEASDSFEAALEKVRSAAEAILNQLRSLAQPPDEVAVEFGVKMSAETGAIIAKASGEANFKINIMWKKTPAGK